MSRAEALRAIRRRPRRRRRAARRRASISSGVGEMGIGNTTAGERHHGRPDRRPVELVTGRGHRRRRRRHGGARSRPSSGRSRSTGPTRPTRSACSRPSAGSRSASWSASSSARPRPGSRSCSTASSRARPRWSRPPSQPAIVPRLIAGHRSPEPGHAVILEHLGLDPSSTWSCASARGAAQRWRWGWWRPRSPSATGWRRSRSAACPDRVDADPPAEQRPLTGRGRRPCRS